MYYIRDILRIEFFNGFLTDKTWFDMKSKQNEYLPQVHFVTFLIYIQRHSKPKMKRWKGGAAFTFVFNLNS